MPFSGRPCQQALRVALLGSIHLLYAPLDQTKDAQGHDGKKIHRTAHSTPSILFSCLVCSALLTPQLACALACALVYLRACFACLLNCLLGRPGPAGNGHPTHGGLKQPPRIVNSRVQEFTPAKCACCCALPPCLRAISLSSSSKVPLGLGAERNS